MEERLFFNGVYMPGTRHPINQRIEGAAPVFPDAAYTTLVLSNQAVVPAEMTMYLIAVKFFIE